MIVSLFSTLILSAPAEARNTPPNRKSNHANPRPHPRTLGPRSTRGLRRERFRGGSPQQLYLLQPQALRELETSELSLIAEHMYGLDATEKARVEAEIVRIQDARWIDKDGNHTYSDLITKRASRFQTLTGGAELETLSPVELAKIRVDREFAKINGDIRRFERKHPVQFSVIAEQLETVIDPSKVSAAQAEWRDRAGKLPGPFKARHLLRGIQTRRFTGNKQGGRSVGARPGVVKPKIMAVGPAVKKRPPARAGRSTPPKATLKPPPPKNAGIKSVRKPKPTIKSKRGSRRPTERARPLNEWEKYVRDFIVEYDLSEAQRNASLSILREMTARAVRIEKVNQDRITEAEKISDRKRRTKRLKELKEPIDRLFHDMKLRLDGLLTAAQRIKTTGSKSKRRK
ncbi:MAG: hypothetical protein ACE5EQ_11765 [Phycisphaerae bacterium]